VRGWFIGVALHPQAGGARREVNHDFDRMTDRILEAYLAAWPKP